MGELIWQPKYIYQPEWNDFQILLNPKFAEEMFNSKLTEQKYKMIQDLPKNIMGFRNPDPYFFHKGNCFLRQITLHGGDGKWLALDNLGGRNPDFNRPIKYFTHNLDYRPSASDVKTLMGLFDLYVEYSELLK